MGNWNDIKNRYPNHKPFWGVVNKEGNWIDSSQTFEVAVHWAAMDSSVDSERLFDEEIQIMKEEGYSIIHCSLLEKLVDAGLIK